MKDPKDMADGEISLALRSLRHDGGLLHPECGSSLRLIADRIRELLDEQDRRIPDEPPGEEMGKILTAFAGTVVTISIKCACCNERLSTTGVAGEKLDAELEHFRRSESWERLPRRESNPVRPHPVDICWVCVNEINPDLDPQNEIGRLRHELAIARSERDLALGKGEE